MKIEIFGASNAILKNGWHTTLSDNYNVKNYAVAGSNSGIGIIKYLNKGEDICGNISLINFGVSEIDELDNGFITSEHISDLVNGIYSCIRENKSIGISLTLPRLSYIKNNREDLIASIHKKNAENTSCIYVDGEEFVRNIKEMTGVSYDDLFLDDMHLSPVIAKSIGMAISKTIEYIREMRLEKEFRGKTDSNEFFYQCSDEVFPKSPVDNIGSSIIREDVTILKKGDCGTFLRDGLLHGIYVDCAKSTCKIKIKTKNKTMVKNVYCRSPFTKPGRSQFKFCTLVNPLFVEKNDTIEIVGNDVGVTEITRGELPFHDKEVTGYLCGFLFSKKQSSSTGIYDLLNLEDVQNKTNQYLSEFANYSAELISISTGAINPTVNLLNDFHLSGDFLNSIFLAFEKLGFKDQMDLIRRDVDNKSNGAIRTSRKHLIDIGFFDSEYYLDKYQDVKRAGVDPYVHYVTYGHKEGRNPCSNFDTKQYKKKFKISENPLFHYLRTNY